MHVIYYSPRNLTSQSIYFGASAKRSFIIIYWIIGPMPFNRQCWQKSNTKWNNGIGLAVFRCRQMIQMIRQWYRWCVWVELCVCVSFNLATCAPRFQMIKIIKSDIMCAVQPCFIRLRRTCFSLSNYISIALAVCACIQSSARPHFQSIFYYFYYSFTCSIQRTQVCYIEQSIERYTCDIHGFSMDDRVCVRTF